MAKACPPALFIAAGLLLLGMPEVRAQAPRQTLTNAEIAANLGNFIAVAGTIACLTEEEAPGPTGMEPCLHIGPLRIGISRREVEGLLGPVIQTSEMNGETYFVHRPAGHEEEAYFAVSYDAARRVNTIQMTSSVPLEGYTFANLAIGDPAAAVLRQLGRPDEVRATADIPAQLWDYQPFPFSIEILDGRIHSIKVLEPSLVVMQRSDPS